MQSYTRPSYPVKKGFLLLAFVFQLGIVAAMAGLTCAVMIEKLVYKRRFKRIARGDKGQGEVFSLNFEIF